MSRHTWNAALGLLALAGIAACSMTPTLAQQLTIACQGADSALRVAIAADSQGKLSAGQKHGITLAGTAINEVCARSTPPDNIPAALDTVARAVADLSGQVH